MGENLVAREDRSKSNRAKKAIINVVDRYYNRFDLNRTRVAEGKRVTDMERGERRSNQGKVGAKGSLRFYSRDRDEKEEGRKLWRLRNSKRKIRSRLT